MLQDMQTRTFGVEIEVEGIESRAALSRSLALALGEGAYVYGDRAVVDGQRRNWQVKGDGSLDSTGCEIASPPLTMADMPMLRAVLDMLNGIGARTDSGRCGMHIHVGAQDLTAKNVANLVTLIYGHEAHIYKALEITDRRASNYTRPHFDSVVRAVRRAAQRNNATVSDVARAWVNETDSRYYGVNLHAYQRHYTVEFRYFNGTIDPDKVEAYVTFVLALTAYAKAKRSVAMKEQRPFVEDCARFDFRVLLVHLGLNGKEFKLARKVLVGNLPGNNRRAVGRTCTATDAYESLPTVKAARAAQAAQATA